jgi:hypothetical protein
MDTLMDSIGRNILHVAAACGNNFGVALAVRSKMDVRKRTQNSFSFPPLFFFLPSCTYIKIPPTTY